MHSYACTWGSGELKKNNTSGWSAEKLEAVIHDVAEAAKVDGDLLAVCRKHRITTIQAMKAVARARHRSIATERKERLDQIAPKAWNGLEVGLDRLIEKDKLGAKLTKEARATLVAMGHLNPDHQEQSHRPMFNIEGGAKVTVNVIRKEGLNESVHLALSQGATGPDGGDSSDESGEGDEGGDSLVRAEQFEVHQR